MSKDSKLVRTEISCDISGLYKESVNIAEQEEDYVRKPSILLHSCCGPCCTSVVEKLAPEYDITIFYYNPNIVDRAEYIKRRDTQLSFVEQYNLNRERVSLLHYSEGYYDPEKFLHEIKGHEGDPEGGDRCRICFRLRLEKTAFEASMRGFDCFGTTLTVSPHKNYEAISRIGNDFSVMCRLQFLDRDFKKQDGYRRSVELSKKYNLYRQNYCGCGFPR